MQAEEEASGAEYRLKAAEERERAGKVPAPYTLHPTPYTLHPTPYTLQDRTPRAGKVAPVTKRNTHVHSCGWREPSTLNSEP